MESSFFQSTLVAFLLCCRQYAGRDGCKDEQTQVMQIVAFLTRSRLLPQSVVAGVPEGPRSRLSRRMWEELEAGRTVRECHLAVLIRKLRNLHIHDSAISLLNIYSLFISTTSAAHQEDPASVWPAHAPGRYLGAPPRDAQSRPGPRLRPLRATSRFGKARV